jgi:hypothetical protein
MLRRISTGRLIVTMQEGRRGFAYDDGTPVSRADAERLIARGWVKPESQGLFREEPQSYVVPR